MANDLWTDMEDRVLYATREVYPTETWAFVAGVVSSKVGRLVSENAARQRYNRVKEQIDYFDRQNGPGADDMPANVKPADYAGFRMAFYDIETTGLGAGMGRVLCVSIADEFGRIQTKTYADFPERQHHLLDDGPLVRWAREALKEADIWVGWNSILFDQPFLNARLLKGAEEFVLPQDKMHIDLMYQFKGRKARFGSAKMDNVAKNLGVPNQKTPLDFATWERAAIGDMDALEDVVAHCEADVLVLRDIFARARRLIQSVTR